MDAPEPAVITCAREGPLVSELVMVIEDEKEIRDLVRYNLEKAGYRVAAAADGEEGLKQLFASRPDALVLDLMLPGINGLEIVREVRGEPLTHDLPVLILTARSAEMDKLLGFEQGADDYLTKPFSPRELVARVQAVLRRARGGSQGDVIHIGDLTIDIPRLTVTRGSTPIDLTTTEFQLLSTMARHPGRIFTRAQLLDAVRGVEVDAFERAIDAHIKNVRRKLERDSRRPRYVLTVYGVGYKVADA